MYIAIPATFIVQIIAWKFSDAAPRVAGPHERVCVRVAEERNKLFGGNKTIPLSQPRLWRAPLGREESLFMQMAENSTVFVDKSLLIKRILETREKIVIINAPRKSGKTINLSMLKDFLEVRFDKNVSVLPPSKTSTYRFFTTGKLNTSVDRPLVPMSEYLDFPDINDTNDTVIEYFENLRQKIIMEGETVEATYADSLLIANHDQDIIEKHLSQYSIVHLDFKRESVNTSDTTLTEALRERVCYFFEKTMAHVLFRRRTRKGPPANKTVDMEYEYERYIGRCQFGPILTDEELENAVFVASKMQHLWTGRQVIVLIDNYDMLFEDVLFKMHQVQIVDETQPQIKHHIPVLKNFLKRTFAENPYLAKAIITGTLSVSTKTLFHDIPDLRYYNVIDNDFQEFYGFTEGEVQLLFDHFGISVDLANRALPFYNGYTMKPGTNITFYNMESITQFLHNNEITEYWIGEVRDMEFHKGKWQLDRYPRGVDQWLNFAPLCNVLQPLIDGNDTSISFTQVDYDMEEVLLFTRPNKGAFPITKSATNLILSMLLEIGFFTISQRANRSDGENDDIAIRIPNQEIRRGLGEILRDSASRFRVPQF